jgi:hypothetical protein
MTGAALAIAIVVLLFLLWKKWLPAATAALAIAVGAAAIGGTFGSVQHRLTDALSTATSQLTAQLLGVAVASVLGVFMALWVGHDFVKSSVDRGTAIAGFFLPLTVVLIPGTIGSLLVSMVHLWSTTLGTLITSLTSGGQ